MAVQSPRHASKQPSEPTRDDASTRPAGGAVDRPAMLQTMLDHVAQAIAMFDAQHRLVAWNEQLRTLLDLPDTS
jgi:PAS domain-containing protein